MYALHIEHTVRDYERWKAAFDSDPARRRESGVRRYLIARETAEPSRISIDLEFDELADAQTMLARLERIWQTPTARAAVDGSIRATIVEHVEVRDVANAAVR